MEISNIFTLNTMNGPNKLIIKLIFQNIENVVILELSIFNMFLYI